MIRIGIIFEYYVKNINMNVKCFLIGAFVLQFGFSQAQIVEFSTFVSENKISKFENQKLILIDFWATWCAPCVFATQQLEVFQEINKSKVFVISETDETEKKIAKFLERNPINLMVVTDVQKINIEKYDVSSRPCSILLNLDGKLLWSGHPSDLSQKKLDEFYNKSKLIPSKNFTDVVKFSILQTPSKQIDYDYSFEIKNSSDESNNFETSLNGVNFSGKLNHLIAKLSKINPSNVQIETDKNIFVAFKCSVKDWENKSELLDKVSQYYNFNIERTQEEKFANILKVENQNLLWNATEINWEDTKEKMLIGDSKITANDCTIAELAQILSDAKNQNYVYLGNDVAVYDWDFQYKFDDIMAEDLSSTFGIKIINEQILQQILTIRFIK